MFAALAHRDFKLLWLGQSASGLGDALIIVAIGLYVHDLTGSAADTGIVLAAYSLPLVGFLLLGGVIADRLPRNAVMIASDIVRAALHLLLAVLIITDAVEIWHMVAIGVVFGAAEAFFRPAYTGLVPQTVPEQEIQPAQALSALSREVSTFVGPALATALVLGINAATAFTIDALTFVVSALLLARVRPRPRGEQHVRTTVMEELREGWTAVRERTWIFVTVICFSLTIFVALAPFFVLGPKVAETVYDDTAVYGIANAIWGIGTVPAVLLGLRWRPERPMRAATLWALPWPACMGLFAVGAPLWVLFPAMVVSGFGIGLFGVWWETALAERVPPHLLSRVSAYDWMGSLALLPLGYLVAGPLGDEVGHAEVLGVGGAIGLAAMIVCCLPSDTRNLPRYEPDPNSGRPASVVEASA